jgi:UDP-N-acetyl-D-mannosaminuronic acid dehydrogenase
MALVSAHRGRPTTIYDINEDAIAAVRGGNMPFLERGGEAMLNEVLEAGKLELTSDPACIATAEIVILVVGTPVDEYLNPKVQVVFDAIEPCLTHFRPGQVLILRSTVFPGVSRGVQDFFHERGLDVHVAFCPERVAQGFALEEIQALPQIVSAFSEHGRRVATEFFGSLAPRVVELEPLEAELAKLFTNAYRYIQFATVNQFYMIAESQGADYGRIHEAITRDYPRLAHYPGPGFAAGPCLLKDTMQLASFYDHNFSLGLASVWVNEGLPDFLVRQLERRHPLRELTVGILGMAFKGNNDDKRDSLSYKLRKLLRLKAKATLCTDPYIKDDDFLPLERVLDEADVIIVGAPHREYRGLKPPPGKTDVVDVWATLGQ